MRIGADGESEASPHILVISSATPCASAYQMSPAAMTTQNSTRRSILAAPSWQTSLHPLRLTQASYTATITPSTSDAERLARSTHGSGMKSIQKPWNASEHQPQGMYGDTPTLDGASTPK